MKSVNVRKVGMLTAVHILFLFLAGPVLAGDSGHHTPSEPMDTVVEEDTTDFEELDEVTISMDVPLGSHFFDDTPVAILEGEAITFRDLTQGLASVHSGMSGTTGKKTSLKKNYTNVLDRLITTRLIVLEAQAIGLDEIPAIKEEMDAFSSQTLRELLMTRRFDTLEVDPEELDKLYKQLARELRLTTLDFTTEEDALAFQEELDSSHDFDKIAQIFTEQGRASGDLNVQEYTKFNALLPTVAKATLNLEVGDTSEIFSTSSGYVIFRLEGIRYYEDAELKENARELVLTPMLREEGRKYAKLLEKKHATVDEKLLKKIRFAPKKSGMFGTGEAVPVDYEALKKDARVIATVHEEEPYIITVADLAKAVEDKFYHGTKSAFERGKELDKKKDVTLRNILFKRTAQLEAIEIGLDQSEEYLAAVDENTTALLFLTFLNKLVAPDIKITEGEAKEYYKEHLQDFSTPKMLRLNSLAFYEKADSKKAAARLKKSADFKWVSSNSPRQVDKDEENLMKLEKQLLSLTALPESLHIAVEDARQGDAVLYTGDSGFYYVVVVEQVYPSRPDTYEKVRQSIARIIYDGKVQETVSDWAMKLREGYDLRIFVQDFGE